jgi:hypothetical protein
VRRRDGIEEKATRKFTEFFCNYSGRRERILIVDDEKDVGRTFKMRNIENQKGDEFI